MFRSRTLTLGLLVSLAQAPLFAAQESPEKLLLEQGYFWQRANNSERAEEIWKKLLLLNPKQPDALYYLGTLSMRSDNLPAARDYLRRLKELEPVPAQAAQLEGALSDPVLLLTEQGHFWQNTDSTHRAEEVWKKLLQLSPRHPDALYGLGALAVRADRLDEARGYLKRLQALKPTPRQARQLEQDILVKDPEHHAMVTEAIRLEGSGDRLGAIQLYRKLLDGREPQGTIARDYYTNLAYLENDAGWSEAKPGFQRLVREFPNDSNISLLYAKQLIRRLDSRGDGLRLLAKLSQRPEVAGEAYEAWRNALTWIGTPDATWIPYFEQYVALYPEDQELRDQLAKGRARAKSGVGKGGGWVRDRGVEMGLKALERGDVATAEREFQKRLKSAPKDADALGGLGVIRQQQNRLEEAEALLTQATRQANGTGWQPTLNEVRYWRLLEQARLTRDRGDVAGARQLLEQAAKLKPGEPTGQVEMADIKAQAGQLDEAEALYRQLLKKYPQNASVRMGLINVLSQTGEMDEAVRLFETLSPVEQARMGGIGRIRGNQYAQRARRAEQLGDMAGARAALEEALRNDPSDPWTRFALARIYVELGAVKEARSLIDGLLAADPNSPDALYTSALLSMQLGDWRKAQSSMAAIPAQSRTAAMNTLAADIDFNLRMQDVRELLQQGKAQDARALLARAEREAKGNEERLATVAVTYADAGDTDKALALLRSLRADDPAENPRLTLQYAGVLLRREEDAKVAALLHDLQGRKLSADERKLLNDLAFILQIREADKLTAERKVAEAYDLLAPSLAQRPNDPLAISALARMYVASGSPDKAVELYRPLLQRYPHDTQLHLGAAEAAAQNNDKAFARQALAVAMENAPRDPKVLTQAAQIYRRLGESREAAELLREAVAQERLAGTPASTARQPGPAANPFRMQQPGPETRPGAGMSDARKALNEILQERSAYGVVGTQIRHNNGEAGLGRKTELQAPMEANFPIGDSRFAVHVTPVTIQSGKVGSDAADRFGAGPVASAAQPGVSPGTQNASGVGLALSYEDPSAGFKGDLGVTPQGFLYSNVVGGASLTRPLAFDANARWTVNASRRAVTDSVLSFAGAEDKRTGQKWGGVTSTGVRGELGFDDGKVGAYGFAGVYSLRGDNVENNLKGELGAGIYWYLLKDADSQLTAGLSMTAISYQKNLGQYTFGHGGYFSPQQFFALGVPVSWSQRFDRFTYQLNGSVGMQFINEDDADYYPGDDALQAAASAALGREAVYEGNSDAGIGYSFSALGEYQLTSHVFVGGRVAMDNSQDYRQWNGGLYLRYNAEAISRPQALPVQPYQSTYSKP